METTKRDGTKVQLALRARGIFNTHGIVSGRSNVMVYWRSYFRHTPGWIVLHTRKKYPGHWSDHGSKCFCVFGSSVTKADALNEALAFAASECGKYEWVKSPFEGLVPVDDLLDLGLSVPPSKRVYVPRPPPPTSPTATP